MAEPAALEARGLSKSYGTSEVVRNLNLLIAPGLVTAFLGPNGAGKSTTIRMLMGMVSPSRGDGFILGSSISDPKNSASARRSIAFVGERKPLYSYMTVRQIIRFTSGFYPDWQFEEEVRLLKAFELPPSCSVKSLSKGMRTKLALLLAFARKPLLIILDEPGEGLDPVGIEQMLEGIDSQRRCGTTVFLSSHQISDVERIADHVCMINKGRITVDASMNEINQSYRFIDLEFKVLPDEGALRIDGVGSLRRTAKGLRIVTVSNHDAVLSRVQQFFPTSVDMKPINLRELFLEMAKEA
jgi:ABC-2 type transport system ATP-binding protein